MMKMLEAGGMDVLFDSIRQAGGAGQEGQEGGSQTSDQPGWLGKAKGKVVTVLWALLMQLPRDYSYKIIFMRRETEEILTSQKRLLAKTGGSTDKTSEEQLSAWFQQYLKVIQTRLAAQPNCDVLYVNYGDIMDDPREQARRVNHFLGGQLDEEKMAQAVSPRSHRQQR